MATTCCLLLLCEHCGRRQTLRTPMEKFTKISALSAHTHTQRHEFNFAYRISWLHWNFAKNAPKIIVKICQLISILFVSWHFLMRIGVSLFHCFRRIPFGFALLLYFSCKTQQKSSGGENQFKIECNEAENTQL